MSPGALILMVLVLVLVLGVIWGGAAAALIAAWRLERSRDRAATPRRRST